MLADSKPVNDSLKKETVYGKGHEGEVWKQEFAFLSTGKMGFDFLGLGFENKKSNGIFEHVHIENFTILLIGVGIFDYLVLGIGINAPLQDSHRRVHVKLCMRIF